MGNVKSAKLKALISKLTAAANKGTRPAQALEGVHSRKHDLQNRAQPKLRINLKKESLHAVKLLK
jgi:hypothetical protein